MDQATDESSGQDIKEMLELLYVADYSAVNHIPNFKMVLKMATIFDNPFEVTINNTFVKSQIIKHCPIMYVGETGAS